MKKLLLSIIFCLGLIAIPTVALAQGGLVTGATTSGANAACQGANAATGGGGCNSTSGTSIPNLLIKVVDLLSWIVGVVAVIMVIWGGFSIITASGDSAKVGKGRSAIIYALIGLVIVALSQMIVRFVISKFK